MAHFIAGGAFGCANQRDGCAVCRQLRREPFEYVWVTNEFDPARLVANATSTEANQRLFDAVVHVCPEALHIVHELDSPKLARTPARLKELLDSRRIIGLGDWLNGLAS